MEIVVLELFVQLEAHRLDQRRQQSLVVCESFHIWREELALVVDQVTQKTSCLRNVNEPRSFVVDVFPCSNECLYLLVGDSAIVFTRDFVESLQGDSDE